MVRHRFGQLFEALGRLYYEARCIQFLHHFTADTKAIERAETIEKEKEGEERLRR